ncbi:MAG: hypothetical protein IJI35_04465, partial [Kiritimatiellae bacterium]|nr:hypothetical protein [Kiritimatiellia bacterium]
MQTFFLYLGLVGLAVTLPALFAIWLWRVDFHPVLEVVSRIRRHPIAVQLLLVAFVVRLIVFASVKTNENRQVRGGDDPAAFGFTSNQLAMGFVLSRMGVCDSCSFAPPGGASVVEPWLRRGAADDWACGPASVAFPGGSVVFADGRVQDRVRNPSAAFAPFRTTLGVVPAANWPLVASSNAESMVWYAATPSNSVIVTWRDVLFGRDTNTPVSVQAEFFENGDFDYRYDLESIKCKVESGELGVGDLTNVVVGASLGGMPFQMPLADIVADSSLSILNSPFSICFRALAAEDALLADRDGDGISTHDEIFVHGTGPGLYDSDGDGIGDGDEVVQSLDPLSVSVPNDALLARLEAFQTNAAYAAAYVAVTNELVGYRLWDSFSATWPEGAATNLVYERTVRIDRQNGWQHYYLSSRPDSAGGWSLSGLELEWEDSCGESGTVAASPFGDSLYLPLSTNNPSFVTFRLRATAASLRSVNPVYLVGYAPAVSIEGGREIQAPDGRVLTVFTDGSESSIVVSVDRSRRPCRGSLHPFEREMSCLSGLESQTDGELCYEGGFDGGVIVASGAGIWRLPDTVVSGMDQAPRLRGSGSSAEGWYLVVLMPWVKYGYGECLGGGLEWDGDEYTRQYEYPLDSGCLVREWHRGVGGERICECTPEAGCGAEGVADVSVEVDGDTVTATVSVGGEAVWSGSAVHAHDGCGDISRIERPDECDECESGCEHGDCSALEGGSLGSFRFRIPLGVPRKGQVAGFAYLVAEGPMTVTPASFMYLLRGDVGASVATNGTSRTVSCACERGREVLLEPIADGVRATVRKQASGALEHTWEIVNVGGDPCEIRIRQISRLDNVMQDWTYECLENAESGGWDWRATDNISGIREELERLDTLNEDGLLSETRTKYDVYGNWLGEVETVSQIVGERECAVLREVYRRESTGLNTVERHADYWRDTEHPARNGKLRLLWSNDMPWEYHEWNKDGFETMRVEQRNSSPVPTDFPSATSNGFANASALADAFLTTFSYDPLEGDHAHVDDYGKVRCESRYVVRNGTATLIGRTWRRYTHVLAGGYPAVREETWRASSAGASPDDPSNAHSWRTVFDPVTSNAVPIVLRGETAEELDEDGVRTVCSAVLSNGCVAVSARKWRGGEQFPTYGETVLDGVYGQTLRTATHLVDGGVEIEWTESAYDDQGRLRSRVY